MTHDGRRESTLDTRTLAHDDRRRPGRLRLRVRDGGGAGLVRVVEGRSLTLGRSRTANVTLDDPSVSALHAEIRVSASFIELVDLRSHNGTYLNGRRMMHGTLQTGDEIRVGSCLLDLLGIDDVDVDVYPSERFGEVIGRSRIMRELFARLDELAPLSIDVLITGETGTGKEVIARSLHTASSRSRGPFIVLDCGCLPPTLTESALFGHVRGAFTGAERDQTGAFEQADGGTIFIDEIGELPLAQQVKLLRVLDRREYSRVGDNRVRRVDVRVIAATHRDLRRQVEEGNFREDLYYRLARASIEVPPLRRRDGDVEVLAGEFLTEYGRHLTLDDSARTALREHRWRGNVRELRHVIERAALTARGATISRGDLLLQEHRDRATKLEEALRLHTSYRAVHDEVDRWLLPKVLDQFGGILTHAADRLGIGRKKLRNRLKRLGLYQLEDESDQSDPRAAT